MRTILIHIIIFFTSMTVFSQNNEIGIFAGGSNYIGDVGPTTYIHPFSYNISTNVVAGIIYRKNLNERIALRAKFNYAKIGSSDNWPKTAVPPDIEPSVIIVPAAKFPANSANSVF